MEKLGFEDVRVVERRPWGVSDCEIYPLFGEDLIRLMRELIPVERQDRVADSIVIKARLGREA